MSTYLLRKGRPSEDAFTGMLADLMAWWPEHALGLLGRARRFDAGHIGPATGIRLGHHGDPVVTAWPQWTSGEPDLVLEFTRANGGRSVIIVEAKLGASKSSLDELGSAEGESRDQLAKYHRDAVTGRDRPRGRRPDQVDVVYLTHHSGPPVSELTDSLQAMTAHKEPTGDDALYWLSWVDVEMSIRTELESASGSRARALASVAAVLSQEGYEGFSGTWRPDVPEPRGPFPWSFTWSWREATQIAPLGDDHIFWGAA